MFDVKSVKTPLAAYFRLSTHLNPQTDEEEKHMSRVSYASEVRNIMYAIMCTQLDISHAANIMS